MASNPLVEELLATLRKHHPSGSDGRLSPESLADVLWCLVTVTAGAIVCSSPGNVSLRDGLLTTAVQQLVSQVTRPPAPAPSPGAPRVH